MNKKTITLVLGLSMLFSLDAMAEDDVTIRVMEMNEQSKESVLQMIALPEKASTHSQEKLKQTNRVRETERVNADNTENEEMAKEREQEMEEKRNEAEDAHEEQAHEEQAQENRPEPGAGQ